MNKSVLIIFALVAFISCSVPEKKNEIAEIYQSLSEQRNFYYFIDYSYINSKDESSSSIFGLVSLNRNSNSGISTAYFGNNREKLPNYLHSIYLDRKWIHNLSSNIFALESVDVITDSLHSPVLINPEVLLKIETESHTITQNVIDEENVEWVFDLRNTDDQLILIWNEALNRISKLQYIYDVNSKNTYSRKWSFHYLLETEHSRLASVFQHQNQINDQPFL
jgi:hypothetical protein